MSLKTDFENLLNEYNKTLLQCQEGKALFRGESKYTEEHKKEMCEKLDREMKVVDEKTQSYVLKMIANSKASIQGKRLDGTETPEFQAKVSNAVALITNSGGALTDNIALNMVKQFMGDFEYMNFFLTFFNGKSGFEGTRNALNGFNRMIDCLDNMKDAGKVFDSSERTHNSLASGITIGFLKQNLDAYDAVEQEFSALTGQGV